jgi:hypothetical protein
MHPGLHVTLHLLIWIVATIAVGIIGYLMSYDASYYLLDEYGYTSYRYQSENAFSVESIMIVFLGVVLLDHFILFVRACVETNQRNNYPRRVFYVTVNQEGAYGNPYGYYGPGGVPPQFAHRPQIPPMVMVHNPQHLQQQQPQQQQQQQQMWPPAPAMMPTQQSTRASKSAPVAGSGAPQQPSLYGYYAPEPPAAFSAATPHAPHSQTQPASSGATGTEGNNSAMPSSSTSNTNRD